MLAGLQCANPGDVTDSINASDSGAKLFVIVIVSAVTSDLTAVTYIWYMTYIHIQYPLSLSLAFLHFNSQGRLQKLYDDISRQLSAVDVKDSLKKRVYEDWCRSHQSIYDVICLFSN